MGASMFDVNTTSERIYSKSHKPCDFQRKIVSMDTGDLLPFPAERTLSVATDGTKRKSNGRGGKRAGAGRKHGAADVLPDLRALTLKALMKAGGVEYLVKYAELEPHAFFGLLGKVMPRDVNVELSAEIRIRQEVRRDLVEKLIVLMRTNAPANDETFTPEPLPAIAHESDAMLKAQAAIDRSSDSQRTENLRREGSAAVSGIMQRAEAMHLERARAREAADAEADSLAG